MRGLTPTSTVTAGAKARKRAATLVWGTPAGFPGSSGATLPPVVLALGFGRTQARSVSVAERSLGGRFGKTAAKYRHGWSVYDTGLKRPPRSFPGLTRSQAASLDRHYYMSANVLKASEDKTFPGAIVASLASPWGQAV